MSRYKYVPEDILMLNMDVNKEALNNILDSINNEIAELHSAELEDDFNVKAYKTSYILSNIARISKDWPCIWRPAYRNKTQKPMTVNCPMCGFTPLQKLGINGLYCNLCEKFVIFEGLPEGNGVISAEIKIVDNIMYVFGR